MVVAGPGRAWPVLILVLAVAASALAFEELPFSHLTPENEVNPLPVASVQKVTQDSHGFIWFGFYSGGIARYDGSELELFGSRDGLPELTVREIVEDQAGFLWIGTDAGLAVSTAPLSTQPDTTIKFSSSVGGVELASGRIFRGCMAADSSGGLWVGARGIGLLRYRRQGVADLTVERVKLASVNEAEVHPSTLLMLADGRVLVGLTNGSIVEVAEDTHDAREIAQVPAEVSALAEDRDGMLWVASVDGSLWNVSDAGLVVYPVGLSERIDSITESRDGSLWFSSLGDGALWLSPDVNVPPRHVNRSSGLLSDALWMIFEDREGTLWFAQNGGVSRLRADFKAFGRITARAVPGQLTSLPDSGTFAVLPAGVRSGEQTMWVGSGSGLTAIKPDGRSTTLGSRDGLSSSVIYALHRDHVGRIWAGTLSGLGVVSFGHPPPLSTTAKEYRVRIFGTEATLSSDPRFGIIYSVAQLTLEGAEGPVLAVAGRRGLALLVDGQWFELATAAGLPAVGVTTVAADDNGFVWLSTSGSGVLRSLSPLTKSMVKHSAKTVDEGVSVVGRRLFEPVWNRALGAPTNTPQVLCWVEGRMFVGTAQGLAALDIDPVRLAFMKNRANGLGGDNVRGLAVDPTTGHLWVTQNHGLAEIDPASGAILKVVSKRDGLVDNEAWAHSALSVTADGVVYMATPAGVSVYRPALDSKNIFPPAVVLRHFDVNQDRFGHNEVLAEYAALSFANEKEVQLRTRLVGFDATWSSPSREHKIRYTNLPAFLVPRTYRFEVVAMNEDGVKVAEPAAISFDIRPAWWLTWWAAFFPLAVIAVVSTVFHRLRSRELKRRAANLEDQIQERTAAIEAQARELETIDGIVSIINQEVSMEDLLGTIVNQGRILLPHAEKAHLMTFDSPRQSYRVVSTSGWAPGKLSELALSRQEAKTRWCERGEQQQEGVFLVREPVSYEDQGSDIPAPTCSLTMVMKVGGEVRGYLVFDHFSDNEVFDASDVRVLARFRQHVISAVRKTAMLSELKERSREAQQASQAKSSFLANVSHELRTPLNSIIGFSDLLNTRAADSLKPSHQKFVRNIHESGQHLLSIINDILDLSKVEAGKMALDLEPLELPQVIRGVCTVMFSVAKQRNIDIEIEVPDALPTLYADAIKLKQVLYNLLSNAVKFSPDGSVVTIEAEVLDEHSSVLDCVSVQVIVLDHGIGIAPENVEMVFEAFKQVESSASRSFGGTGLGLALVRRFVELHGGVVAVTSVLGEGSTFVVTLPLHRRDV